MANHTKVPGKTQLRLYLAKGLTQAQIVDAWEADSGERVSRAAIGMAIERYGLKSANTRNLYPDLLPWVLGRHTHKLDARMLRLVGRKRQGLKISPKEEIRLAKWLADLEDAGAVVHFEPDTDEGFFWIPRSVEHGDDLIDRSNATKPEGKAAPASAEAVRRRVRVAKRPD